MNKTQALIAAQMLDMASETYSNHGCNDFWLEYTPENEQFVRDMIAASDYPDAEPHIVRGKLVMMDWQVMDFCALLLRKFINE